MNLHNISVVYIFMYVLIFIRYHDLQFVQKQLQPLHSLYGYDLHKVSVNC